MTRENPSSLNASLLFFLAGAAAGAVVVALTTPKKGADLREDLTGLGRRAKRRVDGLAQQVRGACCAARDQDDLGAAEAAWDELKDGAARAGADLKQGVQDAAANLSR